jgi:hypothetical protein
LDAFKSYHCAGTLTRPPDQIDIGGDLTELNRKVNLPWYHSEYADAPPAPAEEGYIYFLISSDPWHASTGSTQGSFRLHCDLEAVRCAVARSRLLDCTIGDWMAVRDSAPSGKSGPLCTAGRLLPPHMCCMQKRGHAIGLGVEWLRCVSGPKLQLSVSIRT